MSNFTLYIMFSKRESLHTRVHYGSVQNRLRTTYLLQQCPSDTTEFVPDRPEQCLVTLLTGPPTRHAMLFALLHKTLLGPNTNNHRWKQDFQDYHDSKNQTLHPCFMVSCFSFHNNALSFTIHPFFYKTTTAMLLVTPSMNCSRRTLKLTLIFLN